MAVLRRRGFVLRLSPKGGEVARRLKI